MVGWNSGRWVVGNNRREYQTICRHPSNSGGSQTREKCTWVVRVSPLSEHKPPPGGRRGIADCGSRTRIGRSAAHSPFCSGAASRAGGGGGELRIAIGRFGVRAKRRTRPQRSGTRSRTRGREWNPTTGNWMFSRRRHRVRVRERERERWALGPRMRGTHSPFCSGAASRADGGGGPTKLLASQMRIPTQKKAAARMVPPPSSERLLRPCAA